MRYVCVCTCLSVMGRFPLCFSCKVYVNPDVFFFLFDILSGCSIGKEKKRKEKERKEANKGERKRNKKASQGLGVGVGVGGRRERKTYAFPIESLR